MPVDQLASTETAYADAVTVLATALDELGARIYRDVHVDSSYIDLPEGSKLAESLTDFSAYADQCLTALDNPVVKQALTAARRRRP